MVNAYVRMGRYSRSILLFRKPLTAVLLQPILMTQLWSKMETVLIMLISKDQVSGEIRTFLNHFVYGSLIGAKRRSTIAIILAFQLVPMQIPAPL